jgi:hypothetical protein
LQLRTQQVDDFLRAVDVGLEVPQIGMAVAIFFTADFAGATSSIRPAAPPTTFDGGNASSLMRFCSSSTSLFS